MKQQQLNLWRKENKSISLENAFYDFINLAHRCISLNGYNAHAIFTFGRFSVSSIRFTRIKQMMNTV